MGSSKRFVVDTSGTGKFAGKFFIETFQGCSSATPFIMGMAQLEYA